MIAGIRTFSISEFEFTETLSSAGRLDLRISMRKADRVSCDAQDAGRLSRLKIVRQILAELQMRVMQLAREGSPPPRLRLLQAKLSRNSNQIARGRIRRFESDMPSHAVDRHCRPASPPLGREHIPETPSSFGPRPGRLLARFTERPRYHHSSSDPRLRVAVSCALSRYAGLTSNVPVAG